MMDFFQAIKQISELSEEERYMLLCMIAVTCPNIVESKRKQVFVPMNKDIVEDSDKAKEYVRITQGEVDNKMYSCMNWGQYYKKLCNDGSLISSPQGTLMRLEMDLLNGLINN